MGYSSVSLVEQILANALTRGTDTDVDGLVNIIDIGKQIRNTISSETVVQYIRWADEEIDGALTSLYIVPLKRVARGSYDILADVSIGDTTVTVEDATRFHDGDTVKVSDGLITETKIVDTVLSENSLEFTTVFANNFLAADSKVKRTGYPDPVPLISARFAAANLYDKYFAAQSDQNISEYGKVLRKMGEIDLNNLLNGRQKLLGQRIIGRRFYNPNLLDTPYVASEDKNRESPS